MKNDGLLNRSITKMLRQFSSRRTTSSSGSTSTAPEREEAWLVKQASALLTDVEAGILASNCVICNDKRGWKPADDSDAGSIPPILCWKLAFSLELQLKARGRGSGMWDLKSRKNRTHDLKIVWESLLDVDKEKARHGLKQYANMSNFDGKLETVRNAYKNFQYLTDSPHRDCKKALRSLVLLNMGFMKGCYDKPRFINVETGLLNVKTLALDDFTVAERTVLKECERKGFIVECQQLLRHLRSEFKLWTLRIFRRESDVHTLSSVAGDLVQSRRVEEELGIVASGRRSPEGDAGVAPRPARRSGAE